MKAHPEHSLSVIENNEISIPLVLAEHPDTECLLVTYGDYSAEMLSRLPNLKRIIATTTATEYIDLAYCKNHQIKVQNTQNYTQTAVAEHLMAFLFSLARRMPRISRLDENSFSNEEKIGFELANKKIGILGLGKIGEKFAELITPLTTEIYFLENKSQTSRFARPLPLDTLLSTADVLVSTLPLTEKTHYLINDTKLNLLKKNVIIISTSPEDIFDMKALYQKLSRQEIFGLGLDLHKEWPEFYQFDQFIGTRTKGWYTKECVTRRTQAFLSLI